MMAAPTTTFLCLLAAAVVASGQDSLAFAASQDNDSDERELLINRKGEFQNWVTTPGVGGPFEQLFRPRNSVDGDFQDTDFLTGLNALQDIVAQAEANGNKQVRACGSTLSMNNIAYTTEYLVESGNLNYLKIGIDDNDDVQAAYQPIKDRLVFVQSGVTVEHLYDALFIEDLTLKTSLNPHGTRFVGAVSTGSHSSANAFGAMADYVKAVHIIIPGGEHVLLQSDSDPVVTESYAAGMDNATLINNNAMLNAAVVGLGSFGLIHGMLIEAEPNYMLKMQIDEFSYRKAKSVISTLDVASLGFETETDERPFDVSIWMTPYRRNGGFLVRIYEKVPVTERALLETDKDDEAQQRELIDERQKNDKALSLKAGSPFLNLLRGPIRFILGRVQNPIFKRLFGFSENGKTKYPLEWFRIEGTEKRTAPLQLVFYEELEIYVPLERAEEAVDRILDIMEAKPVLGKIGIRYIKPSKATLGHGDCGEDLCAIISLLGFYLDAFSRFFRLLDIFELVYDDLESSDIPYSYHWGKRLPEREGWVEKSFGDALDEWRDQRIALLGETGAEMFSNQMLEDIGLFE